MSRRAESTPVEVVHIITTLTTGGAERQLELLTAASARPSVVIALYDGGPVAESMRLAGQRVEVLGVRGWRRLFAPFLLARRLRALRPDVVHVHLLSGQLLGIPAARLAGVPVVLSTEHSLMEHSIEGRPHRWWLRSLYRLLERMSSHTVAVSPTAADRLERWGIEPSRISVAELGIDFDGLRYDAQAGARLRAELVIPPSATVVVSVGRLEPVKRLDIVLRACVPLLRDGAFLLFAGSGASRGTLCALAERLELDRQVRWLGSRDDVGQVLSAADVLVSASADETFGMAVVEGLASGLPVLYAACPAVDALGSPPVHAVRVEPTGQRDADVTAFMSALVGVAGQRRRWPVPDELRERYGVPAAAARVESVYARLLEASRA